MDKTSKIPLYSQLIDKLVTKINDGEYKAHDKLPSERELCEIYQLSRITVRQALQGLEREEYIYKEHGKGTFVAPKSFDQQLERLYSFTNEMNKIGKNPTTKVLYFQKIAVDEMLAEKLNLKVYDEAWKIIRLRLANGQPLMYETSFLPANVFPDLTEQDLAEQPMYTVFSEKYDVGVTRATERFSATSIRQNEAINLNISEGKPGMLIKRYAYDRDLLIEYTISVARGDKFSYTVELS